MTSLWITGKIEPPPNEVSFRVSVDGIDHELTLTRDQCVMYFSAPYALGAVGLSFTLAKIAPFTLGRMARRLAVQKPNGIPADIEAGWQFENKRANQSKLVVKNSKPIDNSQEM